MTQGLRELQPYDISAELERIVFPLLAEQLKSRGPGHCMKVADFDTELMVRLCGRLRAEVPSATVVVLTDNSKGSIIKELAVSSTKLVELRNPLPDGSLRPPLLVFVPSEVRTAAEDSFGVATFEELDVGDIYSLLRDQLISEVPSGIRGSLIECLRRVENKGDKWPFADTVSVVRFLLTAKVNGGDPETYGGALYELGLIPDFELFSDAARAPAKIARNQSCVFKLTWSSKTERGRVLDLDLNNRAFRNKVGNFLTESGVEDPRSWTRRIVLDRNLWGIAFNRWEFTDGGKEPDSIYIGDVVIELPRVEEDEKDEKLSQLIGQQILPLGGSGLKKFNVRFRVDPHPSKIQGLSKLVAQIVSKEHGPVGLVRSKAAWKSASVQATVSFNKFNKVDWEEGWHFVRVLAQTENGDLIPLVDEDGKPLPWAPQESEHTLTRPNESDLFYVLPEGEVDIEPPQRAVQREESLEHAKLKLQFSAILDNRDQDVIQPKDVTWAEKHSQGRSIGSEMIEVKFSREGTWHIPVSRTLKVVEQKILAAPEGPVNWRVSINLGVAGTSTGESTRWPDCAAAKTFLASRSRYFEAVRNGTKELITQAADIRSLRSVIYDYAASYLSLVKSLHKRTEATEPNEARRAFADLRRVLAVDSIFLTITDHRETRREATIVAPTHPLRALWFATWAELGFSWLEKTKTAPKESVIAVREALLRHLAPISFPPVLPIETGHVLTSIDNISPFWTLYAPSHEEDPRGLLGDVCTAFGLPEPAIGGALIDGAYLAGRVRRYLLQHPYVKTLVINAFNAGRGSILADMLIQLQKEPAFDDLRYVIRLFVPDPEATSVGESISELLSPTASIAAREADAFSTPAENHLRPKLRLACLPTREFKASPSSHAAHLSLLFDVFPAEEIGAMRATRREAASPVHGLIQDFHVEYHEDEKSISWQRQPRHGLATPLDGAEELTDLLASLSMLLSSTTATVATAQSGLNLRPVVTLALDAEDRALLHQVHEVSDWVVTLDRNMGIEFYDHGGKEGRPDYLIDHSPDMTGNFGHRLVITSRSVTELEAMLRPVLEEHHLKAEGRHAAAILEQLRSLSGRLALKLISSPSQRAEALGLALSRMYLQHQGVFENQIVVPLDAHLEFYQVLKNHADELGDEVSFKRTDLALFDLDASHRLITCRLVEVKCYNQVGDLGAFSQLKRAITEQIQQSENVIAHHFDPHRNPVDRPDRLLKTRELVTMLEFYLDRAQRYGIAAPEAGEEARFFLRTLEDGYRLAFTRSALVFDFEKPGTEPPESEAGIEFHRIGVNLIQQLVEAAAPDTDSSISESGDLGPSETHPPTGIQVIRKRRERAPSVPTLDSAAFLGTPRDRSVSWDELHAKRALGENGADIEDAPVTAEDQIPVIDGKAPEKPVKKPKTSAKSKPTQKIHGDKSQSIKDETMPPPKTKLGDGGPKYDVLLGASTASPQFGILGEITGRKIAVDLNETHTMSLFGVQGGGKSYTLGTVAEMASLQIPNINQLPQPLATVIFHYSPTMDYRPEFTSMVAPNSDEGQKKALRENYGAEPKALTDVVLLAPADKLEDRKAEYPNIEIYPLKFAANELQTSHWRFLMGAVGNQATYIRQLNRVMKSLRDDLTLDGLRQGIDASKLPDHLKEMARMRLDLAAEYIDDNVRLKSIIRPGRFIIVDLRDEFIEKDEALGLFVVLLQLFADAKYEGKSFNKLVVFDEAHKYIESPDLVAGLVEVVREMRHKGTSIMVASQDPPSVPISLIELSTQIILHKFNSPAWLKHIQKANAALGGLTPEKMAHLRPGEAYVWSSKATDEVFTKGAIKIKCRPRVTQHGGATKTAVEE